ncbi:uncharacterized protein LOC113771988 [Coffea eugenioides]|uniref:uncharacterized protein LOC113771988 n=1 Tax=Coffea eugenioides TaxID=49369 RepID=UPI000F613940|nr:uncharacterized protein LOC113771988 [Coffea eugenioides]
MAMRIAYTALELRKKLLGKEFPVWVVDAVITDFQTRGFINDGLYAETFSRSRWSSSTWGPRRIKKALYSKGVSIMDTEKAIKLVFNDASACEDEESGLGISKRSMDHLFSQASKHAQNLAYFHLLVAPAASSPSDGVNWYEDGEVAPVASSPSDDFNWYEDGEDVHKSGKHSHREQGFPRLPLLSALAPDADAKVFWV